MIIHIDCNNFFASCERVFRPELDDRGVAVLSNNDGCVIARSDEVKAIGANMAQPYFELRDLFDRNQVEVFSANFSLYGDMSRRVYEVLSQSLSRVEIYSIDEVFADLSHQAVADFDDLAKELINRVYRATRLPVSIGIGPNKTLAKLATHLAKQDKLRTGGKFIINDAITELDNELLLSVKINDIWGFGRAISRKLEANNIKTLAQLLELALDDNLADKNQLGFGTVGMRTLRELLGEKVISFDSNPSTQKSMMISRSFGKSLSDKNQLDAAIVNFASRLAWNLRRKNLLARTLTIFASASRYDSQNFRLQRSQTYAAEQLINDTNSSAEVIKAALKGIDEIFDPRVNYKRAGVCAAKTVTKGYGRLSILDTRANELSELERRDHSIDAINKRFGKGTVRRAAEISSNAKWRSSRSLVSPKYTERWQDIPRIV